MSAKRPTSGSGNPGNTSSWVTVKRGGAVRGPQRRWIRQSIYILGPLAVLTAVVIGLLREREVDCRSAAVKSSDGDAVLVCRHEYERTQEPLTGAYLADALRRTGNIQAAAALASELLGTSVRADALQILGKIAVAQARFDDAIKALEQARQLHRLAANHVALARDDQAIAEVQNMQGQYGEALQILDEAISEAHVGGDALTEAYCGLSAVRVLMRVGYFDAAHRELDRASEWLSSDRDLVQLWFVRGQLEQELVRGPIGRPHHEQAVAAFLRSLELAQRAGATGMLLNLHLSLAFSLAELGRTDEADRHLSDAGVLDSSGSYQVQRSEIAARIAYRRGNRALASSLNAQLYPTIKDNDERIDVCVMQAQIALAIGDLAAAEQWARRGVDSVEQVRAAQTLSELRPWVLASRRAPFEVLFSIYARDHRIEDAIGMFDRWQGRTLLDQMTRASPDSAGLATTAIAIQSLGRWLPAVSKAPPRMTDAHAVIETLGKIDLIAFAVAERRVWRLAAWHGRLELDDLGKFDDLRDRLDRFMASPTDPALADELGALTLPSDVMRKTAEPLYVLLDAPLTSIPIVALRRVGQPLIAVRPVLRTPRFPVGTACAPRPGARSALVLADAAGNLPDARREGSRIAALFGTTPFVGAEATSTALFAARSNALVHIAVGAEVDAGGGVIYLHDRAVSAAEISANKLGPPLVVLSSTSTARSRDPEVAGSLSNAFLAGGSDQVVATLRPVSDTGLLELMSRFYGARGDSDPIRVLARVQAELAGSDNKEWPNFAVFGMCTPPP